MINDPYNSKDNPLHTNISHRIHALRAHTEGLTYVAFIVLS